MADQRSGFHAGQERSRQAGSARKAGAVSVFYFDLGSPEAYLAAERLAGDSKVQWQPVLAAELPGGGHAFRCAEERDIYMVEIERRAADAGLQPVRWPDQWPFDSELAMRVATYAAQIGRVVAFSLAAFRQVFAAGRDLSGLDGVVIAAAACEMHPNAVLKAAETRAVREALAQATRKAAAGGVTEVPAIR